MFCSCSGSPSSLCLRLEPSRRMETHAIGSGIECPMTPRPLSIVVPTYNRASLIGRALTSVQPDLLPGDQVVVVDDASTDHTPDIVKAFPFAEYVRIPHGGAGRARNAGVSHARHHMVAFLDSDDEFIPGTLGCKRALMDARRDLVFCFSNFSGQPEHGPRVPARVVDWSGDPRPWDEILAPGQPLSTLVADPCAVDPRVHIGSMYRQEMTAGYIAINTVIVSRELAGDAMRFPEDLPTYEDWECFGRLSGRGPCAFLAFDSAIQHGHSQPRLTDAAMEVRVSARLALLGRVWGSDASFLATYADDYSRTCDGQRLLGAKILILQGRLPEARAYLAAVRGGPIWARAARQVPIPSVALKTFRALKHWRQQQHQ